MNMTPETATTQSPAGPNGKPGRSWKTLVAGLWKEHRDCADARITLSA